LSEKVSAWRDNNYKNIEKESFNILTHINKVGYLHQPQVEALETYIYLKEVIGNETMAQAVKKIFKEERKLVEFLDLPQNKEKDLLYSQDRKEILDTCLKEKFGNVDYPNSVYALTMGSGKTILMGTMMLYEFVLSFYHPKDKRFAKNILVFAPDTTIIESLKEIKSFDFTKVLPKQFHNITLNIKYHYLEKTDTPLSPLGNYNVVVSNSQKIILKTKHKKSSSLIGLLADTKQLEKQEQENIRLQSIRQLENLIIFVDEAHHSYGTNLEGKLKKTRQTIDFIHTRGKTPLVGVVNLTGTPYVKNKMISDVVYSFGLRDGIEKGILKQVRFLQYNNVKNERFLQEVIDTFWNEYGEKRLDGRLPKIAFYASNIEDLQQNLRPKLESILLKKQIGLEKILEFHTSAEGSKEPFKLLDEPESTHQFILLVGKGTEGWNCRSLSACAMYRKPKSRIFVLQASTRCLRSIGNNSTIARIFLSSENADVLNKELKLNFNTSIEELDNQPQKTKEHTLNIKKSKEIKVKKQIKKVISSQSQNIEDIVVNWNDFDDKASPAYLVESGFYLNNNVTADYRQKSPKKLLTKAQGFGYYEIIETISRYTHLSCLDVAQIVDSSGLSRQKFVSKIKTNQTALLFLTDSILKQVYQYKTKNIEVEEVVKLTKAYPFKINIANHRDNLVVYRQEKDLNKLGFHIDPYNFDSLDEKNLFNSLRGALLDNEVVTDLFFIGGVGEPMHNDFYFEYYHPERKRTALYFPDFLIETSGGRYLVVEVKTSQERFGYEHDKKQYSGDKENVVNEVFAKEVGFREFKKRNANFDYHIIFDASLQEQQRKLFKHIESL
jgi:type III restriction enzyme